MRVKSLAVAGALTLGLLAPAGTAMAAATSDHPGPLGDLLGVLGDHDGSNGRHLGPRHVAHFAYTGTIRSIDADDRVLVMGHGTEGGRTTRIHVADGARITREGDEIKLRDLRTGDHVRIFGSKKNGRFTARWIRVDTR